MTSLADGGRWVRPIREHQAAVEAFLAGSLRFTDIAEVLAEVLEAAPRGELTRDAITEADRHARDLAEAWVARLGARTAGG